VTDIGTGSLIDVGNKINAQRELWPIELLASFKIGEALLEFRLLVLLRERAMVYSVYHKAQI